MGRGKILVTARWIIIELTFNPSKIAIKFPKPPLQNKIDDAIKRVDGDPNRIHHIMQNKHAWAKLMANPSWDKISPVLNQTLKNGTKIPYKGVDSKIMMHKGLQVQVVYRNLNGKIYISDAWVITR